MSAVGSSPGACAVGIDVGGTKIASLLVDRNGAILDRDVRPTPAHEQEATLQAMEASSRAVVTAEVAAIGISAAGLVEAGTGIMRYAPNLSWRDAPLVERIGGTFGLPTVADNDNNAAAWGEYRFGIGRGHANILLVGVGTGIGGGIIADGALLRGAHGFAAEIGHTIVEPDGPVCGCGNHGCWEQLASGSAIVRDARAAVMKHPHSLLVKLSGGDPAHVTGSMVTEAARQGDTVSRGILNEVGHRLGQGIAGLVNVLDPELVIVGGGVSEAGDLLLAPARTAYSRSVEGGAFRPDVPILAASLVNDAGGIGAATMAFELLDRSREPAS
ncbi:MAG TPA: ROK family protein [Actinomycetota bacterium]|nr:ROK family protein [Actinomycetota bacterium]